ncbi:hypothetical protein EV182_008961, partial [Spiromyces aspiralis]
MSKRAHSDGAALPSKQLRSSTTSSTGSNRAPAHVTGDKITIGTDNWIKLVRDNRLLVDKLDLLLHIMDDSSSDVILRPRRFGKSTFLNMIHNFLN